MESTERKRIIDLVWQDSLGLIVSVESGVVYTNQTAGYACAHPEMEGVFVPLFEDHRGATLALSQYFGGDWNSINEEAADFIDGLLRKNSLGFIKVDRSKLTDSHEAWIHVRINEPDQKYSILSGFGDVSGVLTWENSD